MKTYRGRSEAEERALRADKSRAKRATVEGREAHNTRRARYRATAEGRAQERRQANARRQANRDRAAAIKLAGGCIDCGYDAYPEALDFDHLPGTDKQLAVSHLISDGMGWTVIEAEIAKCEVRCANCHRIRTAERNAE